VKRLDLFAKIPGVEQYGKRRRDEFDGEQSEFDNRAFNKGRDLLARIRVRWSDSCGFGHQARRRESIDTLRPSSGSFTLQLLSVQELTVRIVMQQQNRRIPPVETAMPLIQAGFTAKF
jgi:hypothetical protein